MSTTITEGVVRRSAPVPRAGRGWNIPVAAGVALFLLDVVGLLVLWPVALLAFGPALRGWPFAAALVGYPAAAIVAHYAAGLYHRDAGVSVRRGLARVPVAAVLGALGMSAGLLLLAPPAASAGVLAGGCAAAVGAMSRLAFGVLRRRGVFTRTVLVLGAGKRAWDLVWVLQKEGRTIGYRVHFVHDPALGQLDPRLADGLAGTVLTAGPGGIRAAAQAIGPDEIVVAPDERRGMDLQGLLDCKIAGYPVSDYLGFLEREVRRVDIKRIELGWLLYSDGFAMGPLDRALKRVVDVAISSVVLVLMAPAMVIAMAAIRMQDGGPALYRQTRVTLHGRPFQILKLRTMVQNAEAGGAAWAKQGDARVTRLGMLLRRTRLDEVPQLLNVLRGEMSFVGPRPERPEFVDMLSGHLPLYRERHAAKAGLTGWAQVNYPYGASIDDARSKLSYDLYYVKNYSLLLDMLIIVQTLRVVIWPSGVR